MDMTLYGGIDLHANNCVVVVLDDQDRVVYEKRLPNYLEHIVEQLAPYHGSIAGLVVESTYNWYWLVDGLMEAGYRVHLANTAAIQQYSGLKYSDDKSDARCWRTSYALGCCQKGISIPRTTGPYETYYASVAN
jgi:transposase